MNEYERLYRMYIEMSDEDLLKIMNPDSGYTEIAIKVASDIMKSGRKEYSEIQGQEIDSLKINTDEKKLEPWIVVSMVISSIVVIIVLISAYIDFSKSRTSDDISIVGNYYEGSGDYFGIVFFFYDENTYKSTTSGDEVLYGTYSIDKNALTLNMESYTYVAAIVDNGKNLMIGDSELHKLNTVTDAEYIKEYKEIFESAK